MWTYNYTPSSDELYHWGIKGQKWGVRRFQNDDGSLTDVGRKRYRQELRADKKERRSLERDAYDSAKVADLYSKKQKAINKKYENALKKDPDKLSQKTTSLENTKKWLDLNTKLSEDANKANMEKLRSQVDKMVNKYADTKISSVKSTTLKSGVEFVKSCSANAYNSNAVYSLSGITLRDENKKRIGKYYTPTKTRYYYVAV